MHGKSNLDSSKKLQRTFLQNNYNNKAIEDFTLPLHSEEPNRSSHSILSLNEAAKQSVLLKPGFSTFKGKLIFNASKIEANEDNNCGKTTNYMDTFSNNSTVLGNTNNNKHIAEFVTKYSKDNDNIRNSDFERLEVSFGSERDAKNKYKRVPSSRQSNKKSETVIKISNSPNSYEAEASGNSCDQNLILNNMITGKFNVEESLRQISYKIEVNNEPILSKQKEGSPSKKKLISQNVLAGSREKPKKNNFLLNSTQVVNIPNFQVRKHKKNSLSAKLNSNGEIEEYQPNMANDKPIFQHKISKFLNQNISKKDLIKEEESFTLLNRQYSFNLQAINEKSASKIRNSINNKNLDFSFYSNSNKKQLIRSNSKGNIKLNPKVLKY